MKKLLFDLLMPVLPKNDLSHLVGSIVHKPLPGALGRKSVEWFAKYYNINLDEAEHPITHYRTIGDLFTRKLREGARPVGQGVVHCADAVVNEAGPIKDLTLIQAKGKMYTVTELLGGGPYSGDFEGGAFATYYLCPTDYHRVHSPVDGDILWSNHLPGALWPVNDWSVNKIENLFGVNERVALVLQTPKGKVALVMVAATNVGNMSMTVDETITTKKRARNRKANQKTYEPPVPVKRGQEVGIFHMGSTVVMLFEKGVLPVDPITLKNRATKMGAAI
ncbi:MAG: phosphatidylserine decarboxylase [Proteobacteria bacterium]|nr:MAG: phosphatidylserine decarboxylase [Pseudomonadota bacterium]